MCDTLSTSYDLPSCDQENTPPQPCTPEEAPIIRDCRSESRNERNAFILTERSTNTNQEVSQEDNKKQGKTSNQKGKDENSHISSHQKDQLSQLMAQRKLQKYTVKQLIHISKASINFGNTFPGQIVDESLDIVNKSNQNLVVQISLECENPDFQDTEEYVYSIRRSHLYEFNDKHYLIMAPYASASFKVTLKAPNTNKSCSNKGFIDITIQGLKTSHRIDLESNIKVPKVTLPKALVHKESGCRMMKLAVKEGRRQEFKIPVKNEGDVPVTMDFSFYKKDESENEAVDCCVYPGTLTIPANGSAQLNFVVRTKRGNKSQGEKRVLLGKVKDTNLVYSFFFCVETY